MVVKSEMLEVKEGGARGMVNGRGCLIFCESSRNMSKQRSARVGLCVNRYVLLHTPTFAALNSSHSAEWWVGYSPAVTRNKNSCQAFVRARFSSFANALLPRSKAGLDNKLTRKEVQVRRWAKWLLSKLQENYSYRPDELWFRENISGLPQRLRTAWMWQLVKLSAPN